MTSKSTRMPEQFDCPTPANLQFDMNAIESWEMEDGALPRHTPAGSGALPAIRDASGQATRESVASSGAISSRAGLI